MYNYIKKKVLIKNLIIMLQITKGKNIENIVFWLKITKISGKIYSSVPPSSKEGARLLSYPLFISMGEIVLTRSQ